MTVLWFLVGLGTGVLVGGWLHRRLDDNNILTAYDTGFYDGRTNRPYRKVR